MREKIQAVGGIRAEEAIEIATKQMEAELGESAAGKEILKYEDGSVAVMIQDISEQADTAVQYEISEEQMDADTAQTQDAAQEQGAKTGSIMRAYSAQRKERMAKLQQSYQNQTVYPESLIPEIESANEVTEGMLCYIRSTGEYYLPDRELTDEESVKRKQ